MSCPFQNFRATNFYCYKKSANKLVIPLVIINRAKKFDFAPPYCFSLGGDYGLGLRLM